MEETSRRDFSKKSLLEACLFEASKPRGLELEVTFFFLLGAKPLGLGCFDLVNPWVWSQK